MDFFEILAAHRREGRRCVLVTVIDKTGPGPAEPGKKMIVGPGEELHGTVGGGALEEQAVETARTGLGGQPTLLVKYNLQQDAHIDNAVDLPMVCGGEVTLFYEEISGGIPVYLFGGGHVGAALCRALAPLGFFTHVIEHRESVFAQINFADRKYQSGYADFIRESAIPPEAFVLVATPSHQFDYEVLAGLLEKGPLPRYTGMLASKMKKQDLLTKIEREHPDADLSRFYCPVGLETGGGSPEEIAVSIAAEMLAVRYGRDGHRHMRDR